MQTLSLRGRVYSLDALRAIMMLLGLVLHTATTYAAFDFGEAWSLKASQTSMFFYVIVSWIHLFRMPVFFVAAGFFGGLLFYQKGPRAMLLNRVNRILLPLIVGLVIIWPTVWFSFVYSMQAIGGNPEPFKAAYGSIMKMEFIPIKLAHMWFLYDLFLYSILSWVLAMILRGSSVFGTLVQKLGKVLSGPILRLVIMFAIYFLCLFFNNQYVLETNLTFEIHWSLFLNYFIFYMLGWMIYRCNVLDLMNWRPLTQLIMATVAFAIFFVGSVNAGNNIEQYKIWLQVFSALSGTLYVFGFLALFTRYFSHYSPRLSYVMDSAYYVYLIHISFAALLPGLLAHAGLPLWAEYLVTFSGTVVICFTTYHFLVRNSFVGRFLNGKMFKKIPHDPVPDRGALSTS